MTLPYTYQLKGVRKVHQFKGRALIGDSMGMGKSLQSLLYLHRHQLKPAVIVCPASLKWNWEHEALIHFGMRTQILEGTKPIKMPLLANKLLIINYDILYAWLEELRNLNPQLVIIDESGSHIGDRRTRKTKSVQALCKGTPHVLALSGTPLTNRPVELWPPLNILRPDLFPSFYAFAMRFGGPRRTPFGWDFRGASHVEELHQKLTHTCLIRRLKEDVLEELPEKQRHVVLLDIDRRSEYEHATDDFLDWLAKTSPAKVAKASKAEKIAKLSYLKQLAAKLKLKAVIEWIDNFLEGTSEKLIIFAIHKKIIKRLFARYSRISVVVDGSVRGKQRQLAVRQFLSNKSTRLFIGNIKAAGMGWSAKGVSTDATIEFPWAPGTRIQAGRRTHGLGRGEAGKKSTSFYLVAKGTLEEKLIKILQDKQKVLNAVLDGNGKGDQLDIFDQLTQELLKERKRK